MISHARHIGRNVFYDLSHDGKTGNCDASKMRTKKPYRSKQHRHLCHCSTYSNMMLGSEGFVSCMKPIRLDVFTCSMENDGDGIPSETGKKRTAGKPKMGALDI